MINNSNYLISFGNAKTSPFSTEEIRSLIISDKEALRNKIKEKNEMPTYFIHQTHSNEGTILKDSFELSFEKKGDFIITNLKNTAIGVLTADCLPVIFYDTINNAAGIAHAGWKGSVKNIAVNTFENMKINFGSELNTTKVFFGPSSKSCCYEVSQDFESNINPKFINDTLIKRQDKYFFDIPLYNKLVLEQHGITNIDLSNNVCTICNVDFCSFRREKENSRRQMSMIMLK